MLYIIEVLIEVFVCYKLYTEEKRVNLFWYFMVGMFLVFPSLKLFPNFLNPPVLFSVVYTFRLLTRGELNRQWESFPLKWLLLLLLIFHTIQPLTCSWAHLSRSYRMSFEAFMSQYYFLFLGYTMAPLYEDLKNGMSFLGFW